ncbi:hypothetical protein Y032_0224g2730 [Ancylostoma ceylanicum]|uniref:G-protein coupled receptors family 1 profile domain-containing protein n=2 Tax=Ancylostoma ceylanicum TaxID=53326 RepID=A0A016SHK4_9BILA|nr:hypothetical protein Y032_0224g2730 [Ancylostoma ceylanicum]
MTVYIEWYWQVFYILVPTVGIVTNTLIVYVTVIDRRLRSPCNIMIAMIAFGDVFHQLGQYVMVISHDIAPEHVMPQHICMHLQAAPLFGLCFSSVIVLCVAIDRILALKRIYLLILNHQKLYLTLHTTPAVLFSILFVVWSYLLVDDRYVTCGIPDVLTQEAYNACFGAIVVINVLLIICYSYMLYSIRNVVSGPDEGEATETLAQ